jgi:hypothetical protein
MPENDSGVNPKPKKQIGDYLANFAGLEAVLASKDVHPSDKALISIFAIGSAACAGISFNKPPLIVYCIMAGLAMFFALLIFFRHRNEPPSSTG